MLETWFVFRPFFGPQRAHGLYSGRRRSDRRDEQRIKGANVVFFDGTLFRDDEMITSGTGAKTGRRMGHMPIDGEDGSLATLEGIAGRRVYVHINNTNPILIDGSPERVHVERKGWEVAEDGMEIVL
jgi:pyrroloquinoline quinone biosynthesis protein B